MLSIIIPTLNEREHIGKLLDAILAQDIGEPIEVVIADSHSTDGTREIAQGYAPRFAGLRIVDGGLPAVARNNGARVASGEIFVFLDADLDFPSPDFLKRNISYFRQKGLAVASVTFLPQSSKWLDHILTRLSNVAIRTLKHVHPLGSMCIVVTREVFQKSGGYPEDRVLAEDHDFVARCRKFGTFDLLPVKILFSVRRFDDEGRLGIAWKYVVATLHIMFIGPITKPIFKYEFEHHEGKK